MFIPRQPVVDNQFCEYVETSTTGGVGGAVAHAGAAVYIGEFDAVAANTKLESLVTVFDGTNPGGTEQHLFGFLMQKIKTGYHEVHPAGYILKQDFGSSDAIAQAKYSTAGAIDGTQKVPVGVAHDGGIWDTTHYTSDNGTPTVVGNFAAVEAGAGGQHGIGDRLQFLDGLFYLADRVIQVTADADIGNKFQDPPPVALLRGRLRRRVFGRVRVTSCSRCCGFCSWNSVHHWPSASGTSPACPRSNRKS